MTFSPIRCIAVDDEPMALQKLEAYIGKVPFLQLVALCESPYEAMQVMSESQVDALFVDINMPDLNGMDFIGSLERPPMVVFTTAYAEYAVESYRFAAVDYLLKPFDFATFQRAANRLLSLRAQQERRPSAPDDSIYVKVDYRHVNVRIADIIYVSALSEYVQIHLADGRKIVAHLSMKQLLANLPDNFLQVHRSYIVNMSRAREVERMRIVTEDGERIAVGDSYRNAFADYMRLHTIERAPSKETRN